MSITTGVLEYPIHQHTLANGLRVIVSPDHAAPVVAVNIWYDVGSRDEALGATGVAHLFEHVMFQGSANVASGEHLGLLQSIGGSVNATTSFDRTNYFETVPTGALDLALWLEADRLGTLAEALSQEHLDTQRDVVKEEKRQRYDNVPYGSLLRELLSLTFPADHPYGHPTIGTMADLDAFSLTAAKDFFQTHYAPNNAVLTLAGDIEPEAGFAKVEKYFGQLPAREVTPRPSPTPLPPLTGRERKTIREKVPAAASYFAWRIPALGTRDFDCLELACDILGGSQAARLHRRLVRFEELSDGAGANTIALAGGNSLAFAFARALPGADIKVITEIVKEEAESLATSGPSDEEVARALAQYERTWLSLLSDLTSRADQLSGHAVLLGDPTLVNTKLASLADVTATEIRAAAATLTASTAAVLTYEVDHD